MSANLQEPEPPEYALERDDDAFWDEVRPAREPLGSRWFAPALLGLIIAGVPWYLPAGHVGRMIAGMPLWVWICIASSFAISCMTAWLAWFRWDDEPPAPPGDRSGS